MTPLLFVCYTVQHRVVDFLSLSHTIQFISIFVCLFLSFSCGIFVLALFNMFDDGLLWLQTTQPTSCGTVTSVSNCCTNCVEPSRPISLFGQAGHTDPGWLALLLTKAGDVETNPGPTTSHT